MPDQILHKLCTIFEKKVSRYINALLLLLTVVTLVTSDVDFTGILKNKLHLILYLFDVLVFWVIENVNLFLT